MNYKQFVEQLKQDKSFTDVLELLESLRGKMVYYFSHDDPDGISSAAIMTELFDFMGIKYKMALPSNFALPKEDIKDDAYDAIIVTDKGTLKHYDSFYDENKPFLTIDHHFTPGVPEKVMYYNPSLKPNSYCSASFICHNIATALGFRDDITDLYAMVGMKGDWVVDPAVDRIAPYVDAFYKEFAEKFPNLIEKRKNLAPTMFEASQKEVTTLLSRYAHDLHAISGGAFQYFYNDKDEDLKDVFQPDFAFDLLTGFRKTGKNPAAVKNEDEFLNIEGLHKNAKLLLKFFDSDWNKGMDLLSTRIELEKTQDTRVFLYMGEEMNLMPMLGSVALFDYSEGDPSLFIMAAKIGYGVHFSLRATGGNIHAGKLCGDLAERLKDTVSEDKRDMISGGGHPVAAECNVKIADYHYDGALGTFLKQFKEIRSDFDKEKFGV